MANKKQINFNQPAPHVSVRDTAGKPVRLSTLWEKKPLLLAFTRHFGCTQCKEMLDELVEGKERIQQAGLDIAVITQGGFTLFIGVLVIGGFFQIQILQKVAQIGVLKAIGTNNATVALASIIQIIVITVFGVFVGGLLTFLFSLTFPPTIPIVFNGTTSAIAIVALLLIGPIGGLVSIRYAVRIEPLKALGLSS